MRAPGRQPLTAQEWRIILKTIPKPLPASEEHTQPRGMKAERIFEALNRARTNPVSSKQVRKAIKQQLGRRIDNCKAVLRWLADHPEAQISPRGVEKEIVELEKLARNPVSTIGLRYFMLLRAWQVGHGSFTYSGAKEEGAVLDYLVAALPIVYPDERKRTRRAARDAAKNYRLLWF